MKAMGVDAGKALRQAVKELLPSPIILYLGEGQQERAVGECVPEPTAHAPLLLSISLEHVNLFFDV
jgi:hypothetical protein